MYQGISDGRAPLAIVRPVPLFLARAGPHSQSRQAG